MDGRNPPPGGALSDAHLALRLPFNVLHQQLAQELARGQQPALGTTSFLNSTPGLASQLQQSISVRHQPAQELLPLTLVRPVQLGLTLDAAPEIALQSALLRPPLWFLALLLGQLPDQLPNPATASVSISSVASG
ncbi:MAG: hypothetical protein JF922_04375 [Candidatus Dormibacteraeota bacterium]|uniref:Uncharacterized protein n=1 Tax=Candidatus Nephthysia bennettiae TaxID=3127016 RepID=A0A934K7Z5_9BACT|nr:hypothetical protein [Candidatus Dormibacteraeota bacterium]